jgi:hypothetical protein
LARCNSYTAGGVAEVEVGSSLVELSITLETSPYNDI